VVQKGSRTLISIGWQITGQFASLQIHSRLSRTSRPVIILAQLMCQ
jgi:hypothetical protein